MSGFSQMAEDKEKREKRTTTKRRGESAVVDHGTDQSCLYQPSIAIARAFRATGVSFQVREEAKKLQ